MKVVFINDWKYLFSPHAIGGRFSAFTLLNISYIRVDNMIVDGFCVVLFGLGFRVSK